MEGDVVSFVDDPFGLREPVERALQLLVDVLTDEQYETFKEGWFHQRRGSALYKFVYQHPGYVFVYRRWQEPQALPDELTDELGRWQYGCVQARHDDLVFPWPDRMLSFLLAARYLPSFHQIVCWGGGFSVRSDPVTLPPKSLPAS